MKIKLTIIIQIILSYSVWSQNLIPNSGFDILTDCPSFEGQIYLAYPWVKATDLTPNLFNKCSNTIKLKVPNAGSYLYSYQLPKSGDGYAGLFVYRNDNANRCDYIETPLKFELVRGENYYIEFYVSPDLVDYDYWRYTDAVGLALSDTFIYKEIKPHEAFPLEPAIENRGTLIKDTIGWTRVSGCYLAHGGEKFAIVGNFRTDSETLIEVENPDSYPYYSYFYIEDVLIMGFDPLPDTLLICNSDPQKLSAQFLDAKYKWNTGETDSVIYVQKPGVYSVEAFMEKCVLYDTVVVIDGWEFKSGISDTLICLNDFLKLSAPIPGDYYWSTGSNKKDLVIKESGVYEISVDNECGQFNFITDVKIKNCSCDLYIPNAFSPNGDGINDELKVFQDCDFPFKALKFEIFDRWGNQLHSKSNPNPIVWGGKFKDEPVSEGVYIWYLKYEIYKNGLNEIFIKSGDVNVIR